MTKHPFGSRCAAALIKARHLLVLRRQVHDRVRDQVDNGERALDRRRGEVADCHGDMLRARFRTEPRDHRLRQIDPVHRDAALRKRQRDPAGADAEFERVTGPGEIRNEVNDGIDDGRRGLMGVPLVKTLRHVLAEVILSGTAAVSQSARVSPAARGAPCRAAPRARRPSTGRPGLAKQQAGRRTRAVRALCRGRRDGRAYRSALNLEPWGQFLVSCVTSVYRGARLLVIGGPPLPRGETE